MGKSSMPESSETGVWGDWEEASKKEAQVI